MAANNETGVLQPIQRISDLVHELNKNRSSNKIYLHTDAAQAAGKIDIRGYDADYITLTGHKFYGPRIGALCARNLNGTIADIAGTPVFPVFLGGGQETENTPMIVALGAAADFALRDCLTQDSIDLAREKRQYFENLLKDTIGPKSVEIHFENSARLPNTSSVAFPTLLHSEGSIHCGSDLLAHCQDVFVAGTGAACHSDISGWHAANIQTQISPCAHCQATTIYPTLTPRSGSATPLQRESVLSASGVSNTLRRCTVRFSQGKDTEKRQLEAVVNCVADALRTC